jgi:hypothetical protein
MVTPSLEMLPLSTRSFATLAFAAEVVDDPGLLAAYASVFDEDDDATLVLFAPAEEEELVVRRIATAAASVGVNLARCADMVVFATADKDSDARLVRHCCAVLSNNPERRYARPIYTSARVRKLREFADQLQSEDHGAARHPWSYAGAVAHLVNRSGLSEAEVRGGSVTESSLDTVIEWVAQHGPRDRPLQALHVGNFVGISLGHLLAGLRNQHPDSLVVSVDPNLPHRGIHRPQDAVIDLLQHFGLEQGHLLVCGYSLEKSMSNDGYVACDGYDPALAYTEEKAPSGVLPTLSGLGARFDVALMDGNHEGSYLRRELAAITDMLRPGALLALDDVQADWVEIADAFSEVARSDRWPFDYIGWDGRLGLLRRQ